MTLIRTGARLTALATAVAIVASCDTRLPTPARNALDDVIRPAVKFTLSSEVNGTVDVGTPLTVSVTGTDDFGVAYMVTRISNGAQVLGIDTATIKPTQDSVTRDVPVQLGGLTKGDRITIRATISDGATNEKTDSVMVTISDTAGPAMTVSSSTGSQPVTAGNALTIRVTASDSAGIVYAGYRLLRLRTTDSVQVKADSSFVPVGTKLTNFQTPPYSYVVPDTLLPGNYALVGFGLDRSGMYTRNGQPGVAFSVIDGKKPVLTFVAPVAGDSLNVGDTILVTARLQDNIALSKVTFVGTSIRTPPGGNDVTVTYYPQVTAPGGNFRAGLRDTTIQRYLIVNDSIALGTDTLLTITGVLTDLAGNADTVRVKLKLVSGPIASLLNPVPNYSATNGANRPLSLAALSTLGVTKLASGRAAIRAVRRRSTPLSSSTSIRRSSRH